MTQQTLAIIDYGSGNLRSAAKAFEHVIATENLPFNVKITGEAADIDAADRIVLPGQGAFGDCMNGLKSVEGMIPALEKAVLEDKKPFLGICVGMQLLAGKGYEHGEHDGLGWIPGKVVPIKPNDSSLKIPHMGWNTVAYMAQNDEISQNFAVFLKESNKKNDPYFYFVHSFMFESEEKAHVLGRTDYGSDVTALIGRANIIGAQFHPEKSQEDGLALLSAFLRWTPNC
ncbi:MAG: imidazole glycerol phosphate synthase subunit HisH [Alphaproteobacteria bacterium]|nr:imidazole glycerol phosphate synthase subunit HisH [Alphaproteobacteria bacterium]